jgi:hypothetical protein
VELRVYEGDSLLEVRRIELNATVGLWESYSLAFSTEEGGIVSLEVWDTNGEFVGNDYALDDVALHEQNVEETPWPPWAAAVLAAALGTAGLRLRGAMVSGQSR